MFMAIPKKPGKKLKYLDHGLIITSTVITLKPINAKKMTFEDFKSLVSRMRKAQKNYYKTRGVDPMKDQYLKESKQLEREVDEKLNEDTNPKLF